MFRIYKYYFFVCLIGLPLIATGDYENGITAAKNGDFLTASKQFITAAENGDTKAQTILGDMYAGSLTGLVPNDQKAVKWLKRAAENGNAEAQLLLGKMYMYGRGVSKDLDQSVLWIRKAADSGYADAQLFLGRMYEAGYGVEKNLSTMVKWVRKAAEQGHPGAQNHMGSDYVHGDGVEKDQAKAVEWYIKSAENGNALGQMNLAADYANGKGIVKDEVRALAWYILATEQSTSIRREALRRMNDLSSNISSAQIEAAERLSEDLRLNIWRKGQLPTISDSSYLATCIDISAAPTPIADPGNPIKYLGFTAIPPLGSSKMGEKRCGTEPNDINKRTTAVFAKNGKGSYTTIMHIILTNLEDKRFTTSKELLNFAKPLNLAERIGGARIKGIKFKYSKDKSSDRVCVRYKIRGSSDFRDFTRQLSRSKVLGPYHLGFGFLCVHPRDSSILVKAEYKEMGRKNFEMEEREQIKEKAKGFLDSIVYTPIQ